MNAFAFSDVDDHLFAMVHAINSMVSLHITFLMNVHGVHTVCFLTLARPLGKEYMRCIYTPSMC